MRLNRTTLPIVFMLGALAGIAGVQFTRLTGKAPDFAQPVHAAPVYVPYEQAVISAVRSVGPSVVSVRTSEHQPTFFGDEVRQGLGTGVIVSADGYILTNNHVVAGAEQIIVKLDNGKQLPAKSLGGDPRVDLAIIKVDAKNLKPAVTGDSDQIVVGQIVIAIGNPLAFERTVTTGIVSALKRTLGETPQTELEDMIQTDATINPGNSGGPMVNSSGQVIGINTAVVGNAPGGGMGFAVPINYARRVLADVKQFGRVRRPPRLGVQYYDVPREALASGTPNGIMVDVYPGGPADKAGLRPYDIITRIDNQPVSGTSDYSRLLRNKNAGDTINLNVYRPDTGKSFTAKLLLGESQG